MFLFYRVRKLGNTPISDLICNVEFYSFNDIRGVWSLRSSQVSESACEIYFIIIRAATISGAKEN